MCEKGEEAIQQQPQQTTGFTEKVCQPKTTFMHINFE